MPRFFRKKKKPPTYTPPTGPVTMDRQQFRTVFRTRSSFRAYASEVGSMPAGAALGHMFDEQLRGMRSDGYWAYGAATHGVGATSLRFRDQQGAATMLDALDLFVDFEIRKIHDRRTYIGGLRAKANGGQLYTRLTGSSEPEANYYTPAPPRQGRGGAPPVPPRPNLDKAKAWLTHGVTGSTVAFHQELGRLKTSDGSFPLGADATVLTGAWQTLVPGAPVYRGWNDTATQQKYPSDTGGKKLLNEIMAGMAQTGMPARGQNAWYDLALYLYGSIMCAQPFTDGNKRACRLAYALILLSGGVPFIAPTARFGSEMADML